MYDLLHSKCLVYTSKIYCSEKSFNFVFLYARDSHGVMKLGGAVF